MITRTTHRGMARFTAFRPWWLNVQRYETKMGSFWGVKVGPLGFYVRLNWPLRHKECPTAGVEDPELTRILEGIAAERAALGLS